MNNEKTSINEALKLFSVSRTTLYSYLKKLKIKPVKKGNRSYLTNTQMSKIKDFLRGEQQPNKQPEQLKQIEELKKELETKKKEIKKLETQQEKFHFESEKLKTKNIQLETRAEVLDEQNKKILFQMGATAEKMAQLTIENQKLIETSEIQEKRGFFSKLFNFTKK